MRTAVLALVLLCGCRVAPEATGAANDEISVVDASTLPEPFSAEEVRRILALSPLGPPPADPTNRVYADEAAARLGQYLFFDERLSKNGSTSCATCHDPEQGWGDGLRLGEGVAQLERQTMTLWNVAYNRWFFWDGRADTLWSQALIPLENPFEHAGSRLQYAHVVHGDPALRAAYERVFGALPDLSDGERFPPEGRPVPTESGDAHLKLHEETQRKQTRGESGHVEAPFIHPHERAWSAMRDEDRAAVTRVFVNLGKAIAAFERKIISRRAAFDVFVEGVREGDAAKQAALSPASRRGLALFLGKARCHVCHAGPEFSDREFHDDRVPLLTPDMKPDPGRERGIEILRASPFNGVSEYSDAPESDVGMKVEYLPSHYHGASEFKTPTLRNVALTAPYMHQGNFATLEEVVRYYSTLEGALESPSPEKILTPANLSDGEVSDLVAFLRDLTDGDLDPALTRQPASPLPD